MKDLVRLDEFQNSKSLRKVITFVIDLRKQFLKLEEHYFYYYKIVLLVLDD
jgi:hypothetical protein